ncbi:hypothetical protein Hanom_Chr05g00458051 [Helianthus anomalus]
MPFSSLRFGQFCDFHPKVCFFSAWGFKRFRILPFSSFFERQRVEGGASSYSAASKS